MISPLPSYDDELLNSAYANISLIADEVWTYDPEDPFRKLNHSLWIQSCEVIAKYQENSDYRPRLVRDVISESRLAKYGNYEYDEQYEGMYRPDDGKSSGSGPRHFRSTTEAVEPWMLPEVQEHFARLISPNCTRSHREPMFNMQSSAIPILKCNTSVRKESEVVCSSLQSNWNEGSKKRRQKISPKKSKKAGLHDELLPIHKSETNNGPHEKSIEMFARHRRYTVETAAEMQLESRIGSNVVRDIWNAEKFQQHQQNRQRVARQTQPAVQNHQQQQQFYCTLQYQPLILRTEYQRRVLQSPPQPPLPPPPPPPVLSAEVPEFFPKSSLPSITAYSMSSDKERRACQIRYFPSVNDRNYQSDLFPYNRPQHEIATTVFPNTRMSILPATIETNVFRSPQEWFQRIAPPVQLQLTASSSSPLPICTSLRSIHDTAIVHRPLQMYEKFLPCTQPSPTTSIPVYQRPMELYQEPTPKRKSQGVDFNNLILLTKNNIKTRRSKGTAQQPFLLEGSKQSLRTSGRNVQVQWFDRDRCTRGTKEVVTVNALVSELRSFEEKYECCRGAGTSWRTAVDSQQRSSETSRSRNKIFASDSSRCRTSDAEERNRRMKRPLYRDVLANASSGVALENVFEERYDELEQQAMEQYRNSEESLALKYQELERQAMEQYRNTNAGDERRSTPSENQDCFDGQRCSGYGQCSPSRGRPERKGSCFPQITLLKPKGKSLPNVSRGSSCNDDNQQPAIASRSLSALTDRSSKESKNICKGASGDKIDTNVSVRTSSKRHLILMSPFERKSEARRIMKTTDLRGICSLSEAKRNVLGYYRTSEIARDGSGDENITIIQSPSTEVWLSGFWTT
ncbi:unnamed protein product [Lasius platythorax]|uniref:Uncharacterized protein n=1 Tax=Lasius platythorax TaxID=488582 RepID=A0AAV2P4U5_9HYME